MPSFAPLHKARHYSKARVPWQIKSILITIKFLRQRRDLPQVTKIAHAIPDMGDCRILIKML